MADETEETTGTVMVDLGNGVKFAVAVEKEAGEELVAFEGAFKTIETVTKSIETISRETLEAINRLLKKGVTYPAVA